LNLDPIFDPALRLYEGGSFSREHLKADGYTEQEIQDIEGKARAFALDNFNSQSTTPLGGENGVTRYVPKSYEFAGGYSYP
jgi:hypothetical protein